MVWSLTRPEILKQEIKVFFVKYNDPIYVKLEKLDIMIRLASQANIAQVHYSSYDNTEWKCLAMPFETAGWLEELAIMNWWQMDVTHLFHLPKMSRTLDVHG